MNYQQDDWAKWLPMAEFAANNADSDSTKVLPFFANKGYHPQISFDPEQLITPLPTTEQILKEKADSIANHIEALYTML